MAYITVNEHVAELVVQPLATALGGATISVFSSDQTLLGQVVLSDPAYGDVENSVAPLLHTPILLTNQDITGKTAQYALISKGDLLIRLGEQLGTVGVGVPGSGRQLVLSHDVFDGRDIYIESLNLTVGGVDSATNAPEFVAVSPSDGTFWESGTAHEITVEVLRATSVSFSYSTDGGNTYTLIDTVPVDNDNIASVVWSPVVEGANRILVSAHWDGPDKEHQIVITTDMPLFDTFEFHYADYIGQSIGEAGIGLIPIGDYKTNEPGNQWMAYGPDEGTALRNRLQLLSWSYNSGLVVEMAPSDTYTVFCNIQSGDSRGGGVTMGSDSLDDNIRIYRQGRNLEIHTPNNDPIILEDALRSTSDHNWDTQKIVWNRLTNTIRVTTYTGNDTTPVYFESELLNIPAIGGTHIGFYKPPSSRFNARMIRIYSGEVDG